jgi:cell division protein FtsW
VAERPRPGGPDTILLGAVATLVAIGLAMVFSASSVVAVADFHDASYFLKRQAMWLVVAIACAFVAYRIDYRKLRKLAPYVLFATIGGLALVLVPHVGLVAGGARRWLGAGPFQFEPSEFAKLAIVLYLASALAAKGEKIRSFTNGVAPLLAMTFVLAMLVVVQPDFGTASLLVLTAFTMLFVGGARTIHLAAVVAIITPGAALLVRHDPYKWARITAFLDPWKDPRDKGFHIVQSLMALGSGGWFGVGLGFSHQKYFYLPEAYTDFIGAIIGEETGLFGVLVIVALFITFAYRATRIALAAPDRFGFFLVIGATTSILVQAFVNLGVISSSWPVTGVPLPFISFGGTSLVTSVVFAALIANVGRARRSDKAEYERPVERQRTAAAIAR